MSRSSNKSQRGFTIVELLVVLSVLGILIGLVMVTLANFYLSNLKTLNQTIQSSDTRSALGTIEKNLSLTSGFLASIGSLADPYGPSTGIATWTFRGDNPVSSAPVTKPTILIAQAYATSTSNTLVYYPCGETLNPVKNTLIYYVKNKTLYRRTITPANTCAATPIAQKPTCSSSGVGSGFPSCLGSDAVLLTDVSTFKIDYYDKAIDSAPLNTYSQTDPAIQDTDSIRVTIETERTINGTVNKYTSSIRINKFNK